MKKLLALAPSDVAVLPALVLMAGWVLAVGVDRHRWFDSAREANGLFTPAVSMALREGKLDEAASIAHKFSPGSPLALIVAAGLQEYQTRARRDSTQQLKAAGESMERARQVTRVGLDGRTQDLLTAALLAPLIAVFGFVLSVSFSLRRLAVENRTAGVRSVLNVSSALRTVALSLLLSIPSLWAYRELVGRIARFDTEMQQSKGELLDYLDKRADRGSSQ